MGQSYSKEDEPVAADPVADVGHVAGVVAGLQAGELGDVPHLQVAGVVAGLQAGELGDVPHLGHVAGVVAGLQAGELGDVPHLGQVAGVVAGLQAGELGEGVADVGQVADVAARLQAGDVGEDVAANEDQVAHHAVAAVVGQDGESQGKQDELSQCNR
jgi:hypothetical protein